MRQRGKCCAGGAQGPWDPGGANPGSVGAGAGWAGLGTGEKGADEKGLEVWLDGEALWSPMSHSEMLSSHQSGGGYI